MKTAIITGATSGIGKATAELLAQKGFRIILCGRRTEVLEQIKTQLSSVTEVYTLNFDQRHLHDVENAFASLSNYSKNIDVLVNNAGNAHGLEAISDGNTEDCDAMID